MRDLRAELSIDGAVIASGEAICVRELTRSPARAQAITIKGTFTVKKPLRSAWQTAVVGGLAAAAAFGIAKLIA